MLSEVLILLLELLDLRIALRFKHLYFVQIFGLLLVQLLLQNVDLSMQVEV